MKFAFRPVAVSITVSTRAHALQLCAERGKRGIGSLDVFSVRFYEEVLHVGRGLHSVQFERGGPLSDTLISLLESDKDATNNKGVLLMVEAEYLIGGTSVVKVPELDLNHFTVTQLLPNFNMQALVKHPDWMDSRTYDPKTEKVFLSVHSWVVRHEGKLILIDTGAGNDKDRPNLKVLDHLHNPYLKRLAAVGVVPENVNYILLTHIHADHVGWNTRLEGKEWVPSFPNAKIICSEVEWQYSAALATGDEAALHSIRNAAGIGYPIRLPVSGVFNDSMLPIEAAGRLMRVAIDGSEVLPGVRFLPTPGHSICHASISISSKGEQAVFGGDLVHHPFEFHNPDLTSMFCEFPDAARASRRKLVAELAGNSGPYFSSHFPDTSVGKILRDGNAFRWEFME